MNIDEPWSPWSNASYPIGHPTLTLCSSGAGRQRSPCAICKHAAQFYLLEVRVDQDVVGIDMGAGHERARRLTERVYGGTVRTDHVAQPASCSGQLPVLEKNVDGPAVRCADSHADGSRLVDGVHKPVNSSLDLRRMSRAGTVASLTSEFGHHSGRRARSHVRDQERL